MVGTGWLNSSPLFTFAGITPIHTAMKLGLVVLYRRPKCAWSTTMARRRKDVIIRGGIEASSGTVVRHR